MKRTIIVAGLLALMPPGAWAQCSVNCLSSCCVTTNNCWPGVCGSETSFTTVHKWKQTAPGKVALDGTAFEITFDPVVLDYVLMFKAIVLKRSGVLDNLKSEGVQRARDIQDIGAELK